MKKPLTLALLFLSTLPAARAGDFYPFSFDRRDRLDSGEIREVPSSITASERRRSYRDEDVKVVRGILPREGDEVDFVSWQHEHLRYIFKVRRSNLGRPGEILVWAEDDRIVVDHDKERLTYLRHLQDTMRSRADVASALAGFDLERMAAQPLSPVSFSRAYETGVVEAITWERPGTHLHFDLATGKLAAYRQGRVVDAARFVRAFRDRILDQSRDDEELRTLTVTYAAAFGSLAEAARE